MSAKTIVERAARRVGWADLLIPLIPVLAELLVNIFKNCTETEEQAVATLANPTPAQMRIAHRRILLAMHRDRRIPIRQRNALAWQALFDIVEEASDEPGLVCEAFTEVTADEPVPA